MGPSGCGKSTLGQALADALGWRFLEGDSLHPKINVEKMRSGRPLDDADRAPWLKAVAVALNDVAQHGVVASCSALKRSYRDQLRAEAGPIMFVMPVVARRVLAQRLTTRSGHFMPAALLDSQLVDLEPLGSDEQGFLVDGAAMLQDQVEQVRSRLSAGSAR
jgi:gluconokinase